MKLRSIRGMLAVAASAIVAGSGAGDVLYSSSGGSAGSLTAVSYTGAGATLTDVMNEAFNGSGDFASHSFGASSVNMFLVDFAGTALADAGVTMFTMWGTSSTASSGFQSMVNFTGVSFTLGGGGTSGALDDGTYAAGTNEFYGMGTEAPFLGGLGWSVAGPIGEWTLGAAFGSSHGILPLGFAATNLTDSDFKSLQFDFAMLNGDMNTWRLVNGNGALLVSGDANGGAAGNNSLLLLPVPVPPAIAWGLGGLACLVVSRRWVRRRFC